MESLGKPVVEWIDFQAELFRLCNLEMFMGRSVVNEYFHSVNIQDELPFPDKYDRLCNE